MKYADILIRYASKELSVQVKHADILIRCARTVNIVLPSFVSSTEEKTLLLFTKIESLNSKPA